MMILNQIFRNKTNSISRNNVSSANQAKSDTTNTDAPSSPPARKRRKFHNSMRFLNCFSSKQTEDGDKVKPSRKKAKRSSKKRAAILEKCESSPCDAEKPKNFPFVSNSHFQRQDMADIDDESRDYMISKSVSLCYNLQSVERTIPSFIEKDVQSNLIAPLQRIINPPCLYEVCETNIPPRNFSEDTMSAYFYPTDFPLHHVGASSILVSDSPSYKAAVNPPLSHSLHISTILKQNKMHLWTDSELSTIPYRADKCGSNILSNDLISDTPVLSKTRHRPNLLATVKDSYNPLKLLKSPSLFFQENTLRAACGSTEALPISSTPLEEYKSISPVSLPLDHSMAMQDCQDSPLLELCPFHEAVQCLETLSLYQLDSYNGEPCSSSYSAMAPSTYLPKLDVILISTIREEYSPEVILNLNNLNTFSVPPDHLFSSYQHGQTRRWGLFTSHSNPLIFGSLLLVATALAPSFDVLTRTAFRGINNILSTEVELIIPRSVNEIQWFHSPTSRPLLSSLAILPTRMGVSLSRRNVEWFLTHVIRQFMRMLGLPT